MFYLKHFSELFWQEFFIKFLLTRARVKTRQGKKYYFQSHLTIARRKEKGLSGCPWRIAFTESQKCIPGFHTYRDIIFSYFRNTTEAAQQMILNHKTNSPYVPSKLHHQYANSKHETRAKPIRRIQNICTSLIICFVWINILHIKESQNGDY